MPKYTVSGIDREDGGVRFTTVTANNSDDAAKMVGFQVEKVEQVHDQPSPPAKPPSSRTPSYPVMAIYIVLLLVIGYLLVIIGCLTFLISLLPADGHEGAQIGGGLFALYAVPTGLGLALMGEVLRAFRDIARNSFR